jgi:hypothetical protein
MWADGQTAQLVHAFRNFANESNMDEATVAASRTERTRGKTVSTLGRTHKVDEKFDACGSVHLGNIYCMFYSGPTRCTLYSLFVSWVGVELWGWV